MTSVPFYNQFVIIISFWPFTFVTKQKDDLALPRYTADFEAGFGFEDIHISFLSPQHVNRKYA